MPTKRVDIAHPCPGIDQVMTDYWMWADGEWRHLNDWHMGDGTGSTTRGCESEYAWDCLLEVAEMFGFQQEEFDADSKEEGS